jgi:acyl CoA:acetate/3-ketoacid CoA transferase alpha subunit
LISAASVGVMAAIRVLGVKKTPTGGFAAMLRAGSAAIEARLCRACLETVPQGLRSLN